MNIITLSRYATLFLYGFITYFIFSILSSIANIQTLWLGWSNILEKTFNASNLTSSHSYSIFLFLGGLAVNKIANSFSVYDPKRYWQFNWRYPSLMLSVTCSICIWLFFEFKLNYSLLSLELVFTFLPLLFGLIFLPLFELYKDCIRPLVGDFISKKQKLDKQTLHPHSSTKYIADEIVAVLQQESEKSERIAVCGPFGVGKTTAINLAVEQLKSKNELPKIVRSNIELWGVEAESIIQYVLDEILIALGREIDMCKFRSLPSHYLSAMNAGNTPSKIFAAFIHKPTSPEEILKNLCDVINASNLRLLVIIQDLDRNKEALDSLDKLAGLLDRLEELKGIDYIFAGENTPQFSDTLLRICRRRFDFPVPNLADDVSRFADKLIDENLQKYYNDVLLGSEAKKCPELVNMLLPSFRDFQSLRSQIESSWENIKGEVLLYDFILIQAIKNNRPKFYDVLYQILQGNISTEDLRVNAFIEQYFSDCTPMLKSIIEETFIYFGLINLYGLPDKDSETLGRYISLKHINNHSLSLDNAKIYIILFSGFLDNSVFKKMMVYETLTEVVEGDGNALNALCNGFKDNNKQQLWAYSLNSYGWAMLHNEIEDTNTASSLIHNAIKLDAKKGSLCLLDSLKMRKNKQMNPNSGLRNYLFSKGVIEDLVGLRQHFHCDTFFFICEIYMNFKFIHRINKDKPAEVGKYLNLIVNGFIDSDPEGHLILLLFCDCRSKETALMLDKNTLNLLLKTLNTLELKDVSEEYARLTIICSYEYERNIDETFNNDKKKSTAFVKSIIKAKG
ncbi:MAG: hypothetical protein ACJAT7_003581 [Psychromonas sp.]|jgi:hypothetical protein|uniref:P-loop NTPase fold protein n=1 Tax=Psychromonas sp. TaxID=1884585 RepID=UPI0039E615A7